MNKEELILREILDDLNVIMFSSDLVKKRAIKFCIDLFNYFVYQKSFDEVKHMSLNYFKTMIGGKTDIIKEIKSKLEKQKIIIEYTGLYAKDKRIKSYKFNDKYFNDQFAFVPVKINVFDQMNNNNINSIDKDNNNSIHNQYIKSIINCQSLHISRPLLQLPNNQSITDIENKTKNTIKKIKFDERGSGPLCEDIFNNSFKGAGPLSEIVDENIYDLSLTKTYTMNGIRLKEIANDMGVDKVYFYNNKVYLQTNFIAYKKAELKIIIEKMIYDIENNQRANINETNFRLDTNLTNMYSECWDYITMDGEKLKEIDITNSQFAFLAYILEQNKIDVETDFITKAKEGTLYEDVAEKNNITRKEAKNLMFRIMFDRVIDNQQQNTIRKTYPKLMEFVDKFKTVTKYNQFSIMLQQLEAVVMIHSILKNLQVKYDTILTVHDSFKVKESEYGAINDYVNLFFSRIKFECTTKNKINEAHKHTINDSKSSFNTNILETEEDVQMEPEIALNEVIEDKSILPNDVLLEIDIEYLDKLDPDIDTIREVEKYLKKHLLYNQYVHRNTKRSIKYISLLIENHTIIKQKDIINWIRPINEAIDKHFQKTIIQKQITENK